MSDYTEKSAALLALREARGALNEAKALQSKAGGMTARVVAELACSRLILEYGSLFEEMMAEAVGSEQTDDMEALASAA